MGCIGLEQGIHVSYQLGLELPQLRIFLLGASIVVIRHDGSRSWTNYGA